MNIKNYDVIVIGAGVSGIFATHKLAKSKSDLSVALFDIGRPAQKRRTQMCGFAGLLPFSDGKLYISDELKVEELIGKVKTKSVKNSAITSLKEIDKDLKIIKDTKPNINVLNKIKKHNFQYHLNDYVQLYSKQIHTLCRVFAKEFDINRNIISYFDTEILKIEKNRNYFHIYSETNEYKCKKIILCAGRTGWRWVGKVFEELDLVRDNDIGRFGIRAEMDAGILKDFKNSSLTFSREDLSVGPFCWNGTVIPEDHMDMAISAFRSNEERWRTEKVSFNIIGNKKFENKGMEQTDRIANLTFILTNERIAKEKISSILSEKSKISIIPEYDWMGNIITELSDIIPDIENKGYFHIPTIVPLPPKINLDKNLMSKDLDGLYCAGETAGVVGLWAAMLTGLAAADGAMK